MSRQCHLIEVATLLSMMVLPALILRWLSAIPLSSRTADFRDQKIHLDANNEINITIFSDLHYGEEEDGWGIDQDVNSTRVIKDILDYENPDFVILNGDLITGENTFLENSTKYVDVIVENLVQRKVPWASTYGNHDSQYNLSREALFAEESKYSLSYTQHSPPGVPAITNYYLPIYPPKSAHSLNLDKPVAILWFFDSQGGAPYRAPANSESIPDWVVPEIVKWFYAEQEALRLKWGELPSIAFVHIPPSAFLDVQNALFPDGQESANFPGLNADFPLAIQGDGTQDIPFMQALVNTPGLHSVHSGHDHGDAWCANWPEWTNITGVSKPHVCFSKHTGYGGYGNWNRGSRILNLKFGKNGMEVDTWVRMENGEIVQSVSLNSTYGKDIYPLTDGEDYSV